MGEIDRLRGELVTAAEYVLPGIFVESLEELYGVGAFVALTQVAARQPAP